MQRFVYETPEVMSRAVADWLMDYEAKILSGQERFTIALSGGSTPQALFERLATEPYRSRLSWAKWHVFWGDERFVPFDDPRNNARMAYQALLDHVPVPPEQVHVMRTDLPPDDSAADYERVLHDYFGNRPATFDLVLLGLGDDGHTLSLFPGTAVVHEERAWVKAYYLDSQAMHRITLTAPVVNRAACVAFLVTGAKKRDALRGVLFGPDQPDVFPAQRIQPVTGNVRWFMDEAAAGDNP
jgi:6-phosphogluconolactonase